MLIHHENTIFAYQNEFNKCMNIEEATSKDIFGDLFNVGARKFLSEKGKKYLHELFKK